jgi:hypothetical protein
MQALILASRGEAEEAAPFVTWLVENGRVSEIGWARASALLGASAVHLGLGASEIALGLLSECLAKPRATTSIMDSIPEAVRTAIGCEAEELATRLVHEVETLLPASRLPLQQHDMASASALLAEARDEREAAAAGFADAAARWHGFGVPYEEAQALLGQGRCLVALGRAPEAAPVLQEARAIFVRLGAKPALEETEGLLGEMGTTGASRMG